MEQHRSGRRALAALSLLSLTSAAGVARADDPSARIDWCGERKLELAGQSMTAQVAWHARTFTHAKITLIAHHGCSNRPSAQERDAVLAAHDRLARWADIPAAELRAYLEALVEPDPDPIARACSRLTPGDQASRGLAKILGCRGAERLVLEDDATSALASAGMAYQCLNADHGSPDIDESTLAEYALCGVEARRIDRGAIDAELASLDVSPAARAKVHIGLRQIATVASMFDKEIAGDRGREELFHRIPERAFDEAQRLSVEFAADLAAVRAFEAKVSRSRQPEVAGCYADLRDRLAARFKRARVTTVDKARAELRGMVTGQIARALATCAGFDGQPAMAAALDAALEGAPEIRGPRSNVYWAVRGAIEAGKGELVSIDELERARIDGPRSPDRDESALDEPIAAHRIKKVVKRVGGVTVEFHPVFKKEIESYGCVETNRVEKYENGRFSYAVKCKSRRVTRRYQEPPASFAAADAAGLARGRTMSMFCREGACVPYAVWKDKHRKRLVGLMTGPL